MAAYHPTAAELLEAVRGFLGEEIQPALTDHNLSFKLRIALNVIKIVERELQLEPQFAQQELTSLRNLLDREEGSPEELNTDLCVRISRGDFDNDDSALLDHLERAALHKLAIDNPSYSTYQRLLATEE